MATLFQLPKTAPVFAGSSLASAKLYFFQSGTLTPIVTYTTAALSVAHTHPVVADGDGVFPAIFLNEGVNATYRMQLKTSTDVLKYDTDSLSTQPQTVELGGNTDTTLSRASAGVLAVEGHNVPTVDQAQTISSAWSFSATITGTGGAQNVSSSFLASSLHPSYAMYYSTAPSNEKIWELVGSASGAFGINANEDTHNFGNRLLLANRTGTSIDDVALYTGASVAVFKLDTNNTATNTRLLIYDVDNATLERVSVGAPDSGGSGFKLLRIPN